MLGADMEGTATSFKDHFSHGSPAYRRYRPSYPPELFEWLAGVAPRRRGIED